MRSLTGNTSPKMKTSDHITAIHEPAHAAAQYRVADSTGVVARDGPLGAAHDFAGDSSLPEDAKGMI